MSQDLPDYSQRKVSYPIRGIDPDRNLHNGNSDLLPDEIGQIGTGISSKNICKNKKVQKIKVKVSEDRKNIVKLTKFASLAQETSQDNIQDSGVLSMEGKTNRFDSHITDTSAT